MVAFSAAAFLMALQLISPLAIAESNTVTMPAECENMSYCVHKGKDYPVEAIQELNEKQQLPQMVLNTRGTNDIGRRWGHNGPEITASLCPSNAEIAAVYYILDYHNKTRVVVQMAGVFEQVFEILTCKKPGIITKPVSQVRRNDLNHLKMYCEDIYYQFEFYVLSDDKKRTEKAHNRYGIPVFCACKYNYSKYTENGDFQHWNQNQY